MNSYTISPSFFERFEFEHLDKYSGSRRDFTNYEYVSQEIKFQKSPVSLESHFTCVLIDFIPDMKELFMKTLGIEYESSSSSGCDGASFSTIKYQNQKHDVKLLLDDYRFNNISGKILLEMTLNLEQFETETSRSTMNLLTMIGNAGGFVGAFNNYVGMLGSFFSALFLKANITENFFIRALSRAEVGHKKVENISDLKSMFEIIKFS